MLVFSEGGKSSDLEKNPQSKVENHKKTSCLLFPGQIGIGNVGIFRGWKIVGPGEKPSEQGREP